MHKIIFPFLVLSVAATCFVSCRISSFVPQTQNVPLFTDKNQFDVVPAITYHSLDLNIAYSPVRHIGIITNVQARSKYVMPEIGVGGYADYNKFIIAELYAGAGYGSMRYRDTAQDFSLFGTGDKKYYDVNITANKYFIQPDIGLRFSEHVELAFSLKTTYWDFINYYYNYERYGYPNTGPPTHRVLQHQDSINLPHGNQVTFEPALTLKAGWKMGKFFVQLGAVELRKYGDYTINPYETNILVNGNSPYTLFFKVGASLFFDFNGRKERE